jgi:nucleotide-binding universal stress UspA family protein
MPGGKFSIRRILVALDASPQSLSALRAAVELSVKLQAQLLGLFVEDIDLLRLAEWPSATELVLPTAKKVSLDLAEMERRLKAQAEQARKALAQAAEEAKVDWSFRVVRGSVASEILAAAAECDLLALGRRGWSQVKRARMGSTASAAIGEAGPTLLLTARGIWTDQPILVFYDGTPPSKRGVLAAAELARIGSGKLTVLLAAPEAKSSEELGEEIVELLRGAKIQFKCKPVDVADEAAVRNALRSEHASVIVLTGKEPFIEPVRLSSILDEVEISALLLGEGTMFEVE